ncbi:hypothetical protein DTO280E4_4136 [Paecilomyces variotii]|nr:hypothetical protein DTO217A2_1536 [Paecilomyces variotii]KAJ9360925.1 hypothetical protein DTO280E4_4136 [Paecilomyces variotii]
MPSMTQITHFNYPFTLRARHFSSSSIYRSSTSDSSPLSAASVASSFLSKFASLGPQTRTQTLDANQLQLLSLTLNRPTLYADSPHLSNAAPPPAGTPLPPGYHLAYFTPPFLEGELGADGTDKSYNPESPFTRRMWAGGEVRWPRRDGEVLNPLRVGQEVRETTKVLSAEPKVVRKTGEEMIVVGVEKMFENEDGVAVIDRRNWVFRKALPTDGPKHNPPQPCVGVSSSQPAPEPSSPTAKVHVRTLKQTPVTLFRFSALTFNGHKIHYSLPWAREVEGHKSIVVHGPLNLISILDFWRDVRGQGGKSDEFSIVPESISYRATNPLYAEEEYRMFLEEDGKEGRVQIYGPTGDVAMKAEIRAF